MWIEKGGDLIFWTYHMLDWKEARQTPSDQKCVQCGGPITKVGPVEDARDSSYDGLACHACRSLIWAKTR